MQLDDLVGRPLQPLGAMQQLGVGAAPLLAGVGRQLDAVDGEHLTPDQPEPIAGEQDLGEQRPDLLAQLAHELGDVGVAGLGIATDGDELDVVQAGLLDAAAGDQPPAIGQQHDLEHDARVVGAGAHLIVAKARIERREVQFVIDQVVQREFEAAGLDLFTEHHGQQPWVAVYRLVSGHAQLLYSRVECMDSD